MLRPPLERSEHRWTCSVSPCKYAARAGPTRPRLQQLSRCSLNGNWTDTNYDLPILNVPLCGTNITRVRCVRYEITRKSRARGAGGARGRFVLGALARGRPTPDGGFEFAVSCVVTCDVPT